MCVQWAAQRIKQKRRWGRQKSLVLETCRIRVQKLDRNWSGGWPHGVPAALVGSTCSCPDPHPWLGGLFCPLPAVFAKSYSCFHPPDPHQCCGPLAAAMEHMRPEGLRVVLSLEAQGRRGFAKHASVWKIQDLSQSQC